MIIFSTNDPDLACSVARHLSETLPGAGAVFIGLAGGHFDIDVRDDCVEAARAALVGITDAAPRKVVEADALGRRLDDVQAEPTLDRREAECMAAIHGTDGIDEFSNDQG